MLAFKVLFSVLILTSLASANVFRATSNLDAYLQSTVKSSLLKGQSGAPPTDKIISVLKRIIGKGGCKANVCFGFDISGPPTAAEYKTQKLFVQLAAVMVGIDSTANFAAFQNTPRGGQVSLLTGNVGKFIKSVALSRLLPSPTNPKSAYRSCFGQLKSAPSANENNVVLITQGAGNLPLKPLRSPLREFYKPVGQAETNLVILSGVDGKLLSMAAGVPNVFRAFDYDGLIDEVFPLVEKICKL